MRIRAALSAAGLVAAALAAVPLAAAHADTGDAGVALPLASYLQMAVDSKHGHLFFSQGSTSENSILVTDFAGKTVATIGRQTGVMGITLSPDGSTLYAALASAHEVTAISTATLKQIAAYPLGDSKIPFSLAVQDGKLWISYDTGAEYHSAIGDLKLSAVAPTLQPQAAMGGWYSAPLLAADPADIGHVLVAAEPGLDSGKAASYNTAADPVQIRAGGSNTFGDSIVCSNAGDLAVVPGGAQFVPACGQPYEHIRYSTADLSEQGSYASSPYPDSIAIASGTGLVAVGVDFSAPAPAVYVYPPGGDTPLATFTAGDGDFGLADRGLGLTADGSKLFAVGDNYPSVGYTLYVYDLPAHQRSALTLTRATSTTTGHSLTLRGSLAVGAAGHQVGATVEIIRTGPHESATLWATTGSGGAFTLTDTPPAAGSYTYTASYAGTASIAPAWAAAAVTVTKPAPALTMTVTPTAATYRPVVHITVHLGPTSSNRTVSVYAKPTASGHATLLRAGIVGSEGTMTMSYPAAYSTTFSAVFKGDARYAAKTVTATASVRALVSAKISGYYARTRIGSLTYRLYHRAARLAATVSVAPNKRGECVKLEVQEYTGGTWHLATRTGCETLGAHSTASEHLALSDAGLGAHYRVRADYERPGKDKANLDADSAWQYFVVEK